MLLLPLVLLAVEAASAAGATQAVLGFVLGSALSILVSERYA